jgi:hypothetical protein
MEEPMKNVLRLLVIAALLIATLAVVPGVQAAGKTPKPAFDIIRGRGPFSGMWSASGTTKLTIKGWNNMHAITYTNKNYAACGGPATGKGKGSIVGGVLHTNITISCNATQTVVATNVDSK